MSQQLGTTESGLPPPNKRKKILVLGTGPVFEEDVIDYAIILAERLSYDLIVMNVDTRWEGMSFINKAGASSKKWRLKAASAGPVGCSFVIRKGDPARAVEELSRQEKRIEFVIADDSVDRGTLVGQIALPVFGIIDNQEKNGGNTMAVKHLNGKKKLLIPTIGFGCLSATLYAAFFMNVSTIMEYCTRGGAYTALPILVALVFSFSHSAFASKTYSLMGIEAAKKNVLQQVERKVIEKKKRARKPQRKYSYVNPFHRM